MKTLHERWHTSETACCAPEEPGIGWTQHFMFTSQCHCPFPTPALTISDLDAWSSCDMSAGASPHPVLKITPPHRLTKSRTQHQKILRELLLPGVMLEVVYWEKRLFHSSVLFKTVAKKCVLRQQFKNWMNTAICHQDFQPSLLINRSNFKSRGGAFGFLCL